MVPQLFTSQFLKRLITTIIGFIGFGIFFYLLPPLFLSFLMLLAGAWIAYKEWPLLCPFSQHLCPFIFLLYPLPSFMMAILLNQTTLTHPLFGWMIIVVNLHDASAYLAGTLFGKHKIAPTISPQKTIEGCTGGFLTLFFLHFFLFARTGSSIGDIAMVSLVISALSTLGDFFESSLKRTAGLKDSGDLLPGHGGLLDRFDALIFVTPFVYLYQNRLFDLINRQLFL